MIQDSSFMDKIRMAKDSWHDPIASTHGIQGTPWGWDHPPMWNTYYLNQYINYFVTWSSLFEIGSETRTPPKDFDSTQDVSFILLQALISVFPLTPVSLIGLVFVLHPLFYPTLFCHYVFQLTVISYLMCRPLPREHLVRLVEPKIRYPLFLGDITKRSSHFIPPTWILHVLTSVQPHLTESDFHV